MKEKNSYNEWEILEDGIRDLHTQMLLQNTNFISERSDILNFSCSCGEAMDVSATRNEEFIYYRAFCKKCRYRVEGIYRWWEENEVEKELGRERFFKDPCYLHFLTPEDMQKIIFSLEKGELEITLTDRYGEPFLQGVLSPVKGCTLYSFYVLGKRKENSINVFFEPINRCRYSLLCLEKSLENKIVVLRNI